MTQVVPTKTAAQQLADDRREFPGIGYLATLPATVPGAALPAPCCDREGSDPNHPKGDPTYRSTCTGCGHTGRQSYHRPTGRYICLVCALAAYHANPPEMPAPQPAPPVRVTPPEEIGEMPAWMLDSCLA